MERANVWLVEITGIILISFGLVMLFGYNSDPSRFGGTGIVGIFMFLVGLIICLYPAMVKQHEESEEKGIEIPELPPVYTNRISRLKKNRP